MHLWCFVCNIFCWRSLPRVCRFHRVLQFSTTVHSRKEELPCLENRIRSWLAVLLKSSLLKDPSTGQMRSSAPTPSSTSFPHLDFRLVWWASNRPFPSSAKLFSTCAPRSRTRLLKETDHVSIYCDRATCSPLCTPASGGPPSGGGLPGDGLRH